MKIGSAQKQRNRKRKGFVAVTYAVMVTGLIGFSGMAIDAGYMQWQKRRVQIAADAAAMGALREMERSNNDSVVAAGQNDAGINGFVNGQNNTVVSILRPPTSGAYAGNNNAVQAVVSRTFPTMFMRVFGQNSIPITADAVARITTVTGNIGGCIFALNKTMKSGLNINGTSLEVNTNCSIIVESNHSEAFTMGGGAVVNLGHEAKVGVVGGWTLGGSSQLRDISHTPYVVRTPVRIQDPGDPLASVPQPAFGNIADTTKRVNSGGVTYSKTNEPADLKIWPGIYCGGIKIGDTDGKTYTFMPGTYILAGGGFSMSATGSKVAGTSVTFFNTGTGGTNYSSWGCPNSGYKELALTGGELKLKAPTSGTFVGMLFFADRLLGATSGTADQIVGNNSSYFDGALYFKRSNLKFAGTSSATGYMVIVADNISINGTTTLGNNYTSLSLPNPFAPYSTGGGLVE